MKRTLSSFWSDKALRLAAALAFYTLLSLAPLLIIATAVAGFFFGEEAVRGELVGQLTSLMGREGGKTIEAMLANAAKPADNAIATIVGVALLLFGASGVFGELQSALNTIWEVKPKEGRGILGIVKDRFLSFAMVLVIGFLLLVSLLLSAALSAMGSFFSNLHPLTAIFWQLVNQAVSFGVITLLFAMIFTVLPDVHLRLRDTLVGAATTALLFTIGKYLIGLYLASSSTASVYGAAGSVVIILLWSYYSSAILFMGAEFTRSYVTKKKGGATIQAKAEPMPQKERAQQGMEPAKEPEPVWSPPAPVHRRAIIRSPERPARIQVAAKPSKAAAGMKSAIVMLAGWAIAGLLMKKARKAALAGGP